jgi:predicted dehydrogenase
MAEFVRLLAAGKVRVVPLISAEYTLEQAAQAYRDLVEKPKEMLAAVFRYDSTKRAENQFSGVTVNLRRLAERRAGTVRVAVIGAGTFARAYHLPNLRKLSNCELVGVVNSTGTRARQVAQEFNAAYCTTDYRDVLGDPNVDAVLIATRHHLHAEMAIAAAQSGKHVFVEKPMGLTLEECQMICRTVCEAGVLLTVGFNRRFAPLVRELKHLLDGISGPKMFTYRVNAGWLPPDHWTLDPLQGGGRILGEGCHFFDLLYYLTSTEPIRIGASQARAPEGQRSDPANVSVCIEFADGSVGTLLYAVVGHTDLPKERLEVFAGGKAMVLDNYTALELHGFHGRQRRPSPGDKGHMQLLQHFFDAVLGETSLEITARDGLRATLCALKALESARTGAFVNVGDENL